MINIKDDLTGQKFEKLTVIKRIDDYISPKGKKIPQYLCECDCGNETSVLSISLKSGKTKSCHRCNVYDLSGEYGICTTSNGKQFYFDKDDYDKIKNYCWHITKDGYVSTTSKLIMHRLIMNCPDDMIVDHINHKKHDNRKSNLRICSNSQNIMNKVLNSNNASGVTGVYWNKRKGKWIASITINGKRIHLGYFIKFDDAVNARKKAEDKYFGEYSYDNSKKLYK